MDIIKSFRISKITALLYDLNITQLDAIYDAVWRFKKEARNHGLQNRDTENA